MPGPRVCSPIVPDLRSDAVCGIGEKTSSLLPFSNELTKINILVFEPQESCLFRPVSNRGRESRNRWSRKFGPESSIRVHIVDFRCNGKVVIGTRPTRPIPPMSTMRPRPTRSPPICNGNVSRSRPHFPIPHGGIIANSGWRGRSAPRDHNAMHWGQGSLGDVCCWTCHVDTPKDE